jgi:hypothetical protein
MYIASHISQVLLFGAANRLGGLKLYPANQLRAKISCLKTKQFCLFGETPSEPALKSRG